MLRIGPGKKHQLWGHAWFTRWYWPSALPTQNPRPFNSWRLSSQSFWLSQANWFQWPIHIDIVTRKESYICIPLSLPWRFYEHWCHHRSCTDGPWVVCCMWSVGAFYWLINKKNASPAIDWSKGFVDTSNQIEASGFHSPITKVLVPTQMPPGWERCILISFFVLHDTIEYRFGAGTVCQLWDFFRDTSDWEEDRTSILQWTLPNCLLSPSNYQVAHHDIP